MDFHTAIIISGLLLDRVHSWRGGHIKVLAHCLGGINAPHCPGELFLIFVYKTLQTRWMKWTVTRIHKRWTISSSSSLIDWLLRCFALKRFPDKLLFSVAIFKDEGMLWMRFLLVSLMNSCGIDGQLRLCGHL